MKITAASEEYIQKAKSLSDEDVERLFSRMGEKLRRRNDKKKVNHLEALAIQLEIEDEMLKEWREKFAEIKAKQDKKKSEAESEGTAKLTPKASKGQPKNNS